MLKKVLSICLCLALVFSLFETVSFADFKFTEKGINNIGFDLNGTENRINYRFASFENWVIDNVNESVYETNGLKFTFTNETGAGVLLSSENKLLYDSGVEDNLLTLDGLSLSKVFNNGVIKLQIEGLSEGTHTLTSWHSYFILNPGVTRSTLTINVNGVDVVTGAEIPSKVSDDEAYIMYTEFTAKENEPVVIYFKSDGNSKYNDIPVINAFEIDGVHPLMDIENPLPADGETHFNPEDGLVWDMPENAVAGRVYLGTDNYSVDTADINFIEYKGKVTEGSFSLDGYEFDNMKTYYWRVDLLFEDGTVVKGDVFSFKVRHLAFPTAEGYGRFANGGRGGEVIEVTSLEDGYNVSIDDEGNEIRTPIEGTLRWALETVKGPRIIVFKVGGVIKLVDDLRIDSEHDDVYIAGQTAPGDGITLINHELGAVGASDVIIRNIRVRVGDSSGIATGGMSLTSSDNCIIDHCSISWGTDENFSSRAAKNITLQRCILAEGLHHSVHYSTEDEQLDGVDLRSYAGTVGGNIGSYHHNLLINNAGRNLFVAGSISNMNTYIGKADIRNNVIYNWCTGTYVENGEQIQFEDNYFKMGYSGQNTTVFSIAADTLGFGCYAKAYLEGNKLVDLNNNVLLKPEKDNPWENAEIINTGDSMENPEACISNEAFFDSYVTEESADGAYESVLSDVGAIVPALDYIDQRYIREVKEGTYTYIGSDKGLLGIIDSQDDAEGYPDETTFKGGEAPLDTDHDGMPDEWEIKHGLNPENYYDAAQIYLSDEGYTNIELYVNELAGDPVNYSENPTVKYNPVTHEPEITATPEVTATPEAEYTVPAYITGDVNDNGVTDAFDALLILKHAARLEHLSESAYVIADVNSDNVIDSKDSLDVLKIAAKLK